MPDTFAVDWSGSGKGQILDETKCTMVGTTCCLMDSE